MKATLVLLALAPLCMAEEMPLLQQLEANASSSIAQPIPTSEMQEKGRAIWEGKQSAAPEDFAAVTTYTKCGLNAGRPRFLVSPDQSVFLCYLHTSNETAVDGVAFAVFHREGDRFICRNHYDFHSKANFEPGKTSFEQDGIVLHFRLHHYKSTLSADVTLKLHYDTPWDTSCFVPTLSEFFEFQGDLTTRFINAVRRMDTATIEEYMKHGYSINDTMPDAQRRGLGSEPSLFLCVLSRCEDEMLARALPYLLQHCGADIHAQGHSGYGVLHAALSQSSKPRAVQELLAAGADPNAADAHGQTPLMLAAARFEPATVKCLLAAGGDVHAQDIVGITAMHRLLSPWFSRGWPHGRTPEESAGYTREICEKMLTTARLLLAAGADINATDKEGRTPIFMVLRDYNMIPEEGMLILLPELVKMGADLTHKDASGKTLAEQLPDWRKNTRKLVTDLIAEQQEAK